MATVAAEMKSKGIDLVNFSVGEPDFNTPPHIINAGKIAMDKGFTKYTAGPGMIEFREAICDKLERENDLNYKVENIDSCNFLLCTGLFDDHESELIFYEKLLLDHIEKKMICTNPDLVVDRGEEREFCAGTVAKIFENLGGEVKYFGKPYPEVYKKAFKNLQGKKVICIGDNLNTDIKGANMQNFDSLLINNGIHKNEISNGIKELTKKYNVNVNYTQTELKW